MKIFVSAAEISSDIHARSILHSLIQQLEARGEKVEIAGIGGPRLRAMPGFHCLENAENLRTMGFVEVVVKYKFFKTTLERVTEFVGDFNPDLILTFDYPDFHLTLLSKIKENNYAPHALKICGIPPKVWVWRSKRVEKIRALYDGVWVIFPFEKAFYESHGIPVIYQGNPLIEELLQPSSESALPIEVRSTRQAIVVMPGSREGELKHHLPLVAPTLELLAKKLNRNIHALVPVPSGISVARYSDALLSTDRVNYTFHLDQAGDCLRLAPVGLIKSGTSTLEAAVLGCVPVIFYKLNKINEWIFRLFVRYLGPVGLPNILLGVKDRKSLVFPEVLGPMATPENLSDALYEILNRKEVLERKKAAGETLIHSLVPVRNDSTVAEAVAKSILEWNSLARTPSGVQHASPGVALVSFLWSSINFGRRKLYQAGILKSVSFKTPSILVGNLQAGGSGKTPIVLELVREALRRKIKVAVVSRGYGRTLGDLERSQNQNHSRASLDAMVIVDTAIDSIQLPALVGDEPAEIKTQFPEVILGIGADREVVVRELERRHPDLGLLIFDDGFQNLKFKTNQTILVMTENSPAQRIYRDFLSQARHANLVIHRKSLFWKMKSLPAEPMILFCGVGDPVAVKAFYTSLGCLILESVFKKDHAQFTRSEVQELIERAKKQNAVVAVTPKDFIKLNALGFTGKDVWVLERELASNQRIVQAIDAAIAGLQR